jgi:hypothetical protein
LERFEFCEYTWICLINLETVRSNQELHKNTIWGEQTFATMSSEASNDLFTTSVTQAKLAGSSDKSVSVLFTHSIPALIDLLADAAIEKSESEDARHTMMEDLLNADSSDSECKINCRGQGMDVSCNTNDQGCTQEVFDELALQSPRSTASNQDLGFHSYMCISDFPRASSSGSSTHHASVPSPFPEFTFEPIRQIVSNVPPPAPKRFYKFWWRGIIRAAYDASRARQIANARASAQELR